MGKISTPPIINEKINNEIACDYRMNVETKTNPSKEKNTWISFCAVECKEIISISCISKESTEHFLSCLNIREVTG